MVAISPMHTLTLNIPSNLYKKKETDFGIRGRFSGVFKNLKNINIGGVYVNQLLSLCDLRIYQQ